MTGDPQHPDEGLSGLGTLTSLFTHEKFYCEADSELFEKKLTKIERTVLSEEALPTARDLLSVGSG